MIGWKKMRMSMRNVRKYTKHWPNKNHQHPRKKKKQITWHFNIPVTLVLFCMRETKRNEMRKKKYKQKNKAEYGIVAHMAINYNNNNSSNRLIQIQGSYRFVCTIHKINLSQWMQSEPQRKHPIKTFRKGKERKETGKYISKLIVDIILEFYTCEIHPFPRNVSF